MPGAGSVGSVALAFWVPRAPRARRPRRGVHCTLGSAPWLVAVGLDDALTSCQACRVPTDSGLVCAEERCLGLWRRGAVPRALAESSADRVHELVSDEGEYRRSWCCRRSRARRLGWDGRSAECRACRSRRRCGRACRRAFGADGGALGVTLGCHDGMGVRQLSRSTEAERAGRGWVFARVARRPEDADVGPNVPPSFEPGAAGPRSRAADAPGLYARLRR